LRALVQTKKKARMLQIFLVTFPFFALVLCGFLAARWHVLPLDAIPGLNSFVLYFALPCLLYRFASTTPIVRLLDPSVSITYLLCALIMVSLTIVTTRRARIGWSDASFGALVAAFPNSGFMGVPLLVALLGTQAAGPAIVSLAVDMVITSSLCLALSRLDAAEEHGVSHAAMNALKGMITNPLPWSIFLGCVATTTNLQLPAAVLRTVQMLAEAASPVALFTIGAVLARSQMNALSRSVGRRMGDVPLIVFYKLVIHPALVFCVGKAAIALGTPLDDFSLKVLVLVAALPSASNVPMLTERFGADTGRVAGVVLLTTAIAFITFSTAVAWLI
jgi:predicted permease